MEPTAAISIVLLNWNGWQDTLDCLDSLARVIYPRFEVVVVDNGSSDGSFDQLVNWCETADVEFECPAGIQHLSVVGSRRPVPEGRRGPGRVCLLGLDENIGFCAGNNLGLAFAMAAGADYALLLNNDTTVDPHFLRFLLLAAQHDKQAGLLAPVICYHDQPGIIWYAGGVFDSWLETRRLGDREELSALQCTEPYSTQWISGCATFVPRATYQLHGGFEEDFFIWSEEWDYSLRVGAGGKRLLVVPQSLVFHKVGKSLGVLKPLSYYYGTRNRLMLKRMHLSPLRRLVAVSVFMATRVPRFAQLALCGRGDLVRSGMAAIRDYLLRRGGKWRAHDT